MNPAATLKQELATLGAATEVGQGFCQDAAVRLRAMADALEAYNPTPAPVSATRLLRGHWKLIWSNLELRRHSTLARLCFNILPATPVHVAELYNQVDPATGLWDNVISFEDRDTGVSGTLVVAGQYFVIDESRVELEFASVRVTTSRGQVVTPITRDQLPPIPIRTTYLDDSFRIIRSDRGSIHVLEKLDPDPIEWARTILRRDRRFKVDR